MASFVKFFLLCFLGLLINQVACGPTNRNHVPKPEKPEEERKEEIYKEHVYKDESHDVDKKTDEKIRDRKREGEKKEKEKREEIIREEGKHPKERVERVEYVEKRAPERPTYAREDKTIMTEDANFRSSYEREAKMT